MDGEGLYAAVLETLGEVGYVGGLPCQGRLGGVGSVGDATDTVAGLPIVSSGGWGEWCVDEVGVCGVVAHYYLLMAPSEACLYGDGSAHCLDHLAGDVEQLRDILQHSSSSSFRCYLLDGATEVDVDDVGMCLVFHYLCCFYHCFGIASVDLYSYRALFVAYGELVDGAFDRAY